MAWVPVLITSFKPVLQEHVSEVDGDCMQACVASLLGLERSSMVPTFHGPDGNRQVAPGYQWMNDQNLWFEYSHPRLSRLLGDQVDVEPEPFEGYGIASVPSALFPGSRHAVVVLDGKVVWDPSPHAAKRVLPYEPVNVFYRLVSTQDPGDDSGT